MAFACGSRGPERCAQLCRRRRPGSGKLLARSVPGSAIARVGGAGWWRRRPRWRSVGNRRSRRPRESASGFCVLGEDAHRNAQGLHVSLELLQVYFFLSQNLVNIFHYAYPSMAVGSVNGSQGRSVAWVRQTKWRKTLTQRGWRSAKKEPAPENKLTGRVEVEICTV